MKVYSTPAAAEALGITEDVIHSYKRAGLPMPQTRVGKFYVFTETDIMEQYDWFMEHGIEVTLPAFAPQLATTSTP